MTIDEILSRIDGAREALAAMEVSDEASTKIALAHCVAALRHAKDADGLTPTRRQQAKSAYRMGAAALGLDHG
jgi:hypothetical protein